MKTSTSMILAAKLRLLLLMAVFAAIFNTACSPRLSVDHIEGQTMGTSFHVSWVAAKGAASKAELEKLIHERLEQINASMSTYKDDSELVAFNQLAPGASVQVSSDFVNTLKVSKQVYADSKGYFDPSVAPLVNLWGFGPAKNTALPRLEQIEQAKNLMGFDALEIGESQISKAKPLEIDLSAVAKGYAVDALAQLLENQQIYNYFVEIGGEVSASGVKPKNEPWRVGIEVPDPLAHELLAAFPITDQSVATSGDYRNFVVHNNQTYSHTMNPVLGAPARHKLASATVLASSCAVADAWATALMAAGETKSLELARSNNLSALLVIRTDTGFELATTGSFDTLIQDQQGVNP